MKKHMIVLMMGQNGGKPQMLTVKVTPAPVSKMMEVALEGLDKSDLIEYRVLMALDDEVIVLAGGTLDDL